MSDTLKLTLLGQPQVARVDARGNEAPLTAWRYKKSLALLFYLATTGRSHSREALIGLLWGESTEANARASLRKSLSDLRKLVGPFVTLTRQEVGLNQEAPTFVDVQAFECALAEGSYGRTVHSVERLQEAEALYQGDFLQGFYVRYAPAFEEWALVEGARLRQLALEALHNLVSHHVALGEAGRAPAITTVMRLLALEPWREGAHRQLMLLYAQSDRRGAALAQFETCRRVLADELGVEPEPETVALYQRIRDGELPVQVLTDEARDAAPTIPHNLPPPRTRFVGRERELADLGGYIADPHVRLITITGPGGIGKTRLALELAAKQLNADLLTAEASRLEGAADSASTVAFPDGVFFLPLAPLSSPNDIVPTLSETISFRFHGDSERTPKQEVLDYLSQKRMLLIMDNLEHLLERLPPFIPPSGGDRRGGNTAADLLVDILRAAPEVQILATSRERLQLQEEHTFNLHGLAVPDGGAEPDPTAETGRDYAAFELFLQTARRVDHTFKLDAQISALTRICRLVQGMPLAIELAASWVDLLSLDEIADRVAGFQSDAAGRSLDLLETEWHDVPGRHRSIRAVFDASWELLNAPCSDAFAQLSVFRGGFTRDAARQVTGASLRSLARLANKSLLGYDRTRDRYQAHTLLHHYGAEKLELRADGGSAVRSRHSAYYCAALGRWHVDLRSARQVQAVAEIEADYENIRSAWLWAVDHADVQGLTSAVGGLSEFFGWHGRWFEGEGLTLGAAEKLQALYGPTPTSPDAARLLVRLLAGQGVLDWPFYGLDYGTRQEKFLRQSLALLENDVLAGEDTRAEEAFVRQQLGRVLKGAPSREQVAEGRQHLDSSLELFRTLADNVGAADALYELHFFAYRDGAPERARSLLNESLALLRQTGDPRRIAQSLVALGHISRELRAYGEAMEYYEQAYTTARAAGQLLGMENARRAAGWLAWFLGDFDAALSFLEEALALSRQAGSRRLMALNLEHIGLTHVYRGHFAQAITSVHEAWAADPDWVGAWPTASLAYTYLHSGRYEDVRAALTGELATKWHPMSHVPVRLLAWTNLAGGKYTEAMALAQRGVDLCRTAQAWQNRNEWRAWAQAPLGLALHYLGREAEAKRELYEALQTCVEIRAFLPLMHLMPVIPVVLASEECDTLKVRAVELYALAESLPFVANSRLFADIAGQHIAATTATLPADVTVAAQKRGKTRDWWDTAETLLKELAELGWAPKPNAE